MKLTSTLMLGFMCLACFKPKPPPPPSPELVSALAAMNQAAKNNDSLPLEDCEKLASALASYSANAAAPIMTQADAKQISMGVAAFCAVEDGTAAPTLTGGSNGHWSQWTALAKKIDRVLAGLPPEEGPRYQLSAPPNVVERAQAVDQALAQGDKELALQKISALMPALSEWSTKAPGMKGARLNEIAERDLMFMSMDSKLTLEQLKSRWSDIKKRMQE